MMIAYAAMAFRLQNEHADPWRHYREPCRAMLIGLIVFAFITYFWTQRVEPELNWRHVAIINRLDE